MKKKLDLCPVFCHYIHMIDSKDRMKEFNKLPCHRISWETFKRLVGQLGMEEGIKKAKKIIQKKLDKQG
jgi:hypothetical protein